MGEIEPIYTLDWLSNKVAVMKGEVTMYHEENEYKTYFIKAMWPNSSAQVWVMMHDGLYVRSGPFPYTEASGVPKAYTPLEIFYSETYNECISKIEELGLMPESEEPIE